jgi:hypothetical protein
MRHESIHHRDEKIKALAPLICAVQTLLTSQKLQKL